MKRNDELVAFDIYSSDDYNLTDFVLTEMTLKELLLENGEDRKSVREMHNSRVALLANFFSRIAKKNSLNSPFHVHSLISLSFSLSLFHSFFHSTLVIAECQESRREGNFLVHFLTLFTTRVYDDPWLSPLPGSLSPSCADKRGIIK